MENFVNVLDFMTEDVRAHVMAGTLQRDTLSGFTAAIATGKPVYVPTGPGWAYMIEDRIDMPSDSTLFSDGALIVLGDSVNSHVIRILDGATNVMIRGLHINGNRANNTSGSGVSMLGDNGGSNITVRDMFIYDCVAHGIQLGGDQSTSLQVHNNRVTNCGAGGVSTGYTVYKFSFEGNHCWLNGTHGVGILGAGKHGAIVGNVCWDNGQGDPTADNITGYSPNNENLTVTGNSCSGGGNNGIHMGGSRITMTGNTSHNAAKHGIVMAGPPEYDGDDCIVADNVSFGSGLNGFWLRRCHSGTVSGNISRNNGSNGVLLENCSNISITNNTARGNTLFGFAYTETVEDCVLSNNLACNNLLSGFFIQASTSGVVSGNLAHDNLEYGFWIDACDQVSINGNTARSNSLSGFYYSGALNDCAFSNNLAKSNVGSGFWIKGCTSGTVSGNIASDNGVHGFWVNVSTNIAVNGNTAHNHAQHGFLLDTSSKVSLSGNTSYSNSLYGFACAGGAQDCVMGNNIAYANLKSGFLFKESGSGVITGNLARDNTEYGFEINNCTNLALTGNTARGNTLSGFANTLSSAWLTFTGNSSRSNGGDGLNLYAVTHSSITGNVINLNTGTGIGISTGESNNIISSNVVRGNTVDQIAAAATTTRINDNETGISIAMPSSATVAIPPSGDFFIINGTTNISALSGVTFAGRRINLKFNGILTVTDGTLKLAGDFTSAADATLSLVYDGSNWVEISRSVN